MRLHVPYLLIALAVGGLVSIAHAEPQQIKDEKIKRFQSVTLNGQVEDEAKVLTHVAYRYSQKRNCLVLFGDPSDPKVKAFRTKATEIFKYMARQGHNMALLHIDSTVYKNGPNDMLEDDDDVYRSPSSLIYCDGLQMSYHPIFSDEEIDVIESFMVRYEHELMGWTEEFRNQN